MFGSSYRRCGGQIVSLAWLAVRIFGVVGSSYLLLAWPAVCIIGVVSSSYLLSAWSAACVVGIVGSLYRWRGRQSLLLAWLADGILIFGWLLQQG